MSGLDNTSRSPTAGGSSFAQSTDNGKSWSVARNPGQVGASPVTAETTQGTFVIGTFGFCQSSDNGVSFSISTRHKFGDKLVTVATNISRNTIYVVGDSTMSGLYLQSSEDGGKTWRQSRIDDAKQSQAWRYPAAHVDSSGRLHVVWMDDRTGYGALYHAYSDDGGKSFSKNNRISDQPFPFPADAPWPPPATQNGTWIGNYLAITSVEGRVIVAWSDQRSGHSRSTVYVSTGTIKTSKRDH